jgi:catechol 2,3-dioxygenase-like lactoylglutathione lyase family enzyme
MRSNIFDNAAMAATVVRVRDLNVSVAWYRDNLGLEPIHVGEDGPDHPIASFVIAGSVVSLWQLPVDGTVARNDPETSTYVVAVMDTDLSPVRNLLVERGVEVGELRRSANHEFFWFYDLDGNRFELSRPNADTY